MTRTDLILYLVNNGYNEKALKILSFNELKRIVILTIAINWGEVELKNK
ncbi:MAG: hypothetical protein IKH36_01825 [Bacilli bacterium]|nr:hypothetical protein [Bacilli bacterium]